MYMNKSDIIERKFIESYDVSDYEILTDTGWEDIDSIHKTIPYDCWTIETESGKKLSGADNHIIFDENKNEIFLKDLHIGDKILTEDGIEKITYVNNDNKQENMYDITVNSENHRFYSNGILSHNSTSYTVYCLWYVITHKQKNILICANRFKTAKDILSRIRLAYMKLPNWLKPGIVTWSASEVAFDNGCKITAEATSENSGRGGSINCIAGDETINVLIRNESYTIPLKRAYDMFNIEHVKTFKNKPLILTKDGWSEFDGIVKFSNKETYEVTIDSNKRVRCTKDHLILNDENAFVEAETYKLSDKKVEDVYDVINVKNGNSFIVNDNITVHNCVILDEFAFLEPSCFDGDTPITLKNTETGEIIETTVEKAKALVEKYV